MPFIFKHNSTDLPRQEQAAQAAAKGITVSLGGKLEDVFSTVTFKIPPKGKQVPRAS